MVHDPRLHSTTRDRFIRSLFVPFVFFRDRFCIFERDKWVKKERKNRSRISPLSLSVSLPLSPSLSLCMTIRSEILRVRVFHDETRALRRVGQRQLDWCPRGNETPRNRVGLGDPASPRTGTAMVTVQDRWSRAHRQVYAYVFRRMENVPVVSQLSQSRGTAGML